MDSHRLSDTAGKEFELLIDETSRIADVVGEWPGPNEEFTIEGPLPKHENIVDVPEKIQAHAAANGWEVCFYDPEGCRTCYCDDKGHMRCVGIC